MMLSRKGTLSRKTRASMRRRQGARGGGAARGGLGLAGGYPGGYSGTRRCSVPTIKPLDTALGTALPCKSDTDLSGSERKSRLTSLQEEHQRLNKASAATGGSCGVLNPAATSSTHASPSYSPRTVSFYGATVLSPSSAAAPYSRSSGRTAEFPVVVDGVVNHKLRSDSSLRLYAPSPGVAGVGSSRTGSDYSLSSLNSSMASGSKVGSVTPHGILVKSGHGASGQTQTHLTPLRGSTAVLTGGVAGGDVAVVVAANGVGPDGKVRISCAVLYG